MRKYIYAIVFTFFVAFQLVAQIQQSTNVNSSDWTTMYRIKSPNAVMLRWFPRNATDWKQGIANGYTITRKKYASTGELKETFNISVPKVNGADTTLAKWAPYWKTDSVYHKELLYLTVNSQKTNSNEELNEMYFFANIMADQSYTAASLCGLGYTDTFATTVENGFSYEYTIRINSTNTQTQIKNVVVTPVPLPDVAPSIFEAKSRKLTIGWQTNKLIDTYSSYFIQRAEKINNVCSTYKTLHTAPLIKFSEDSTMYHVDSLPNKTQTYCYRLIGKSYFDERKVGTMVEYLFQKQLEHVPTVQAVTFSGGNVKVDWQFKGSVEDASSFRIAVSKVDTAQRGQSFFKEIKTGILPSNRTLTFSSADIKTALGDTNSIYYLFVGALADEGTKSVLYSFPYAITPKDKIPPSVPISATSGLPPFNSFEVMPPTQEGVVRIKLRWYPSVDNPGGVGLMGYRVYRLFENQSVDLKVEISGGIINRTEKVGGVTTAFVVDSLGANFNFPSATYFVSALDSNYNESAVTTFKYVKPVTKRPSPPIINKVETVYQGAIPSVTLSYVFSPSGSSVVYKLLKKENVAGSGWGEVKLLATSASYIDYSVKKGSEYVYSMQAIDTVNNFRSCFKTPSLPVNVALHDSCYQLVVVKIPNTALKPAISTFTATYQEVEKRIRLNWSAQPGAISYEIYKGIIRIPADSMKIALLDFVKAPNLAYFDTFFELGRAYKYQIRAVFADGTVSAWKDVSTTSLVQKSLLVNVSEVNFTTKNESKSVSITANIPWTIASSNATWLTISRSSGSNNGTFSITVTQNSGAERNGTITLSGGGITREIRVFQLGVPNGKGLTGKYYNHIGLASIQGKLPDITVIEPTLNLMAGGSPKAGVSENFVAVWEGYIQVKDAANYTFFLSADDGFQFYFNNALVLKGNAYNVGVEFQTPSFNLLPGVNYPIKIEFWDDASVAAFVLKWANNSGLAKQIIPTAHLFPLFEPEPLSSDPLHNKCFVIQSPQTGKALQLMPNFLVQQQSLTNNNDQIWKMEKVNTSYKIISQIDQQGKVMQVLGGGSNNADKVIGGYFSNLNHQLWDFMLKNANLYSIKQKGTSHAFLELSDAGNADQAIIFNYVEREYKLQPIGCPSTSNSILLDKNYVSLGNLPSSDQVVITTGLGWSVTTSDTWIQVNKPGGYGNGVLTISASQNTEFTERKGVVTIFGGNTNYTIYVTQFPAPSGSGLDAKYFNVTSFSGMTSASPVLTRVDENIHFNWGDTSPGSGVNANFAARWEGYIEPPVTSNYTFFVASDDGCRLWINGELIINDNTTHSETEFRSTKEIKMIAGQKYLIKLEFWDGGSGAAAKLRWQNSNGLSKQIVEKKFLYPSGLSLSTNSLTFMKNGGTKSIRVSSDKAWQVSGGGTWLTKSPVNGTQAAQVEIAASPLSGGTFRRENLTFVSEGITKSLQVTQYPTNSNGLTATYFNVTGFNAMETSVPVLKRVDETVDFSWSGSPGQGVNNDFSTRWEGYVSPPETGNYRFFSASDDGVRLFVNGIQTIYDNNPHGEIEFTSDRTFFLEKDKLYPIKMEFWDSGGGAAARLRWTNDVSLSKQIIAKQFLFTAE